MLSTSAKPEKLVNAARLLFSQGEFQLAEQRCREALNGAPDHIEARSLLGALLHSQARYNEAEHVFTDLTCLEPNDARHWSNLATARRCAGLLEEALAAYARSASLGADTADFLFNVALTHIDRNDYESARAVLAKARDLAPTDAEIQYHYARCCQERQQTDEALSALDDWESFAGLTPELVANIGHLLMQLGEIERAEPIVRDAAANPASDPRAKLTLAQLLERTNRVAEARMLSEQLLSDPRAKELAEDILILQANLAQREGRHEIARELFIQALDVCKDEIARHYHEFPLAKSLDALGRYDEAFATLAAAHRSQVERLRITTPLIYARGAPTMGITRFSCDPDDVALWNDAQSPSVEDSPVFIVAFPRSGTTLLEFALDAHPALRSMDEQPFLQNALDDLIGKGIRYPFELGRLTHEQIVDVRNKYWERTRRKVSLQPGQRLVDKNPLNLLRLPVIKRLFPNARIILAIRHPCDVLLSCYMQHFLAPDFVMLCRDLPSLAYGYRRSFDFWYQQHQLLNPKSYELRYENFVDDFEQQARNVIEFLELPWDDAVLKPGENARARRYISTPSYSQVVQPISTKAVGRWHSYQKCFVDVLPTLQPYLERWGYDAAG